MLPEFNPIQPDGWEFLKSYTQARIALGRAGTSLPTKEVLQFRLAHAQAKDAVYSALDFPTLLDSLTKAGFESVSVKTNAHNRDAYLKNPSLGRALHPSSQEQLSNLPKTYDCCFVIADGLSATAVNEHAVPLLSIIAAKLKKLKWSLAPIVIAEQGRVALSDSIGSILKAEIIVMLIGERPGLTSPDSLGIYITYKPEPGLTDERRNCISNVRPEGLPYAFAAEKLFYLLTEMKTRKISGVALKDRQDGLFLG